MFVILLVLLYGWQDLGMDYIVHQNPQYILSK